MCIVCFWLSFQTKKKTKKIKNKTYLPEKNLPKLNVKKPCKTNARVSCAHIFTIVIALEHAGFEDGGWVVSSQKNEKKKNLEKKSLTEIEEKKNTLFQMFQNKKMG